MANRFYLLEVNLLGIIGLVMGLNYFKEKYLLYGMGKGMRQFVILKHQINYQVY